MKNSFSRLPSNLLALIVVLGLIISFSFQDHTSYNKKAAYQYSNLDITPYAPAASGVLKVSGIVRNVAGKRMDSVLVILTDSSGEINLDSFLTEKNGKFNFDLVYNNEFRTYYYKEGFHKSYDLYRTAVPNSKASKDLYAPIVEPRLFTEGDVSINKRALERHPLYIIYFDKSFDMFVEDVENVTAFMDEVVKPNVGEMYVSGVFKDSLIDTFNVKIIAEDTLGFLLAETQSEEDGSYRISVPLMNKIKLRFVSEDHFESFAMVNSRVVPETKSGDDYKVNQNFTLVNKVDSSINEEAFNDPIARIEHLEETNGFVANPAVEKRFENKLLVGHKRIVLTGMIASTAGTPLNNTVITVRDGDVLVEEIMVDSSNFKVNLPYQSIVHVRFKTNGYHDSYISFNTNMDGDEMTKMQSMNIDVELISRDETEINSTAFQKPMAKYYYQADKSTFVSDSSTNAAFLALLNSPLPLPDTAISKTFVTIRGTVVDPTTGFKKVPEARVRVLNENRDMVSSFSTDKKGRYDVTLGLNKIYYLEVEKDGFLATQIKFDTHVPEGLEKKDLEEQYGRDLQIIHPDASYPGKDGKEFKVRQEMLEQNESMAFIYDPEYKEFIEDSKVADAFAESILAYKEPVDDEIPAVTLAQIEEAKRLDDEKLAAEKMEAQRLAALALLAANKKVKIPEMNLAGKVVDERNVPIQGVEIALYDGRKKIGQVETDSLGNYNLKDLPVQKELKLKIEGDNLHSVTADINTKYPDSLEPKSDIIILPTLKAYTKSNTGINTDAFAYDWQKVAYDRKSNRFMLDEKTPTLYANKLNSTPDNQYLVVDGRAKDQKGKSMPNAKILVSSSGRVVDTVYTDKKGRYKLKLDYQKDYRLQVTKEGYESTFAAVSTNTSKKDERLIDKKIKSFNLLLVNKNEKNVNKKVFDKPYSRVAYDPKLNEFVEVSSVNNSFLADLYYELPDEDKEKKKDYQLTSTPVASTLTLANRDEFKEYTTPAGAAQAAAKKRSQNHGQAQKSMHMNNFHDAISGLSIESGKRIQDVTLSLSSIFNARPTYNGQDQKDIDASIGEAAVQKNDFNDIISRALGMRTDADLVSTDSTFNVLLTPRIKHIDQGKKIYKISRDQVYVQGIKTEYVETTDWFVWDTHYKNNKRISGKTYRTELDSIKRIGFYID